MAKDANQLLIELQRNVIFRLTTGEIPITINGEKVEITPELQGENGDYWCELNIKKYRKHHFE